MKKRSLKKLSVSERIISIISEQATAITGLMAELRNRPIPQKAQFMGAMRYVRDLLTIANTHLGIQAPSPERLAIFKAKVARVLTKKAA